MSVVEEFYLSIYVPKDYDGLILYLEKPERITGEAIYNGTARYYSADETLGSAGDLSNYNLIKVDELMASLNN